VKRGTLDMPVIGVAKCRLGRLLSLALAQRRNEEKQERGRQDDCRSDLGIPANWRRRRGQTSVDRRRRTARDRRKQPSYWPCRLTKPLGGSGTDSSQTPRWRKTDSNPQSPLKKDPPRRDVRAFQHFPSERDRGFSNPSCSAAESVSSHRPVRARRSHGCGSFSLSLARQPVQSRLS
jgi:hypothetical protein